jgi:uncharacterized protein (DUF1697 family)
MTPAELTETHDEARSFASDFVERSGPAPTGHHVTLLAAPPDAESARRVEARSEPGEQVRVGKRAVHLMLDKPYSEARNGNAEVERDLGVATTRSLTVITQLAEKWGT